VPSVTCVQPALLLYRMTIDSATQGGLEVPHGLSVPLLMLRVYWPRHPGRLELVAQGLIEPESKTAVSWPELSCPQAESSKLKARKEAICSNFVNFITDPNN